MIPAAVANLACSIYNIRFTENNIARQNPIPFTRFVENCKGINGGQDFPTSFLENVYERIVHVGLIASNNVYAHTSMIVKTGWLNKQGMDFLRIWKRRWFFLSDRTLFYYKKPGVSHFLQDLGFTYSF